MLESANQSRTGVRANRYLGAAVLACVCAVSPVVQAATAVWTGATDTDFENPANWTGGSGGVGSGSTGSATPTAPAPQNSLTTDVASFGSTVASNQPQITASRSIGGLVFNGAGWTLGSSGSTNTLTLGASGINALNQTSGTTTISANLVWAASQTFQVGAGGKISLTGTLARTAGNLTLGSANGTGTISFDGSATGTSTGFIVGGGTVYLNRTTTALNAAATVNAGGTLQLGGSAGLNGNLGDEIGDPRALTLNGSATASAIFDLNGRTEAMGGLTDTSGNTFGLTQNSAAGTTSTLIFNNTANFTYDGLIADGQGKLNIRRNGSGAGTQTLSNANTFSGTTESDRAGGIILANANALQNSTYIGGGSNSGTPNGLAFSSGIGTFTIGGLSGSTNQALVDNGTTPAAIQLRVGNNGSDTTYSGILSGSGGLTKIGSGTLLLSGANSYTGATVVSGGRLAVGPGGSVGNTDIAVNSGALAVLPANGGTVALGSTSTAGARATLAVNGATFDMSGDGAAGTAALLAGSGTTGAQLTLAGANLSFDLLSGAADLLAASGSASVSGNNLIMLDTTAATSLTEGTYNLITAAGGLSGNFSFAGGLTTQTVVVGGKAYALSLSNSNVAESVTVSMTPEPGGLAVIGILAAGAMRRRRTR